MKILRGVFLFMYSLDKGIYRDKIQPNRYFATLSVLAILLVGMVYNVNLADWRDETYWDYLTADWSGRRAFTAAGFVSLGCVWAFNVGEAIAASTRWWVPLVRAGMLAAVFFVFYTIGCMLPPVVTVVAVVVWSIGIVVVEIVAAFTKPKAAADAPYVYEQPAPTPRFCGQCGAPLEPGHQYCGHCGYPV